MNYRYKFSVVSAVYNVEQFVSETIDSLIAQDIGFENIQVILVNDGSSDKSGEICDEYAAKYPDNIVVIHTENGGVSSARNLGLEKVEGKYINFLDADDMLTPDTMSKVWSFFEEHNDEIDVVSIPLFFFDGQSGRHGLNYKFKKQDYIIDLTQQIDAIQLSMASTFIRAEALEGLSFDTRLSYAEDAQLLQKILIKKQTLGAVSSAKYMYRRRQEGASSAIQSSFSNYKWYLPYMLYFQKQTVDHCLKELGYVPEFVQYTLMYDLQFRIKLEEIPEGILSESEKNEYFKAFSYVLGYIDTQIISKQRSLWREQKFFAYCLKYKKAPAFVPVENDLELKYDEDFKLHMANSALSIENVKISKTKIKIDGSLPLFNLPYEDLDIKVVINGEYKDCQIFDRKKPTYALGFEIQKVYGFKFKGELSELKNKNDISFCVKIGDNYINLKYFIAKGFCPFEPNVKNSYYCENGWIIDAKGSKLRLKKNNYVNHFFCELAFLKELVRSKRSAVRRAAAYRLFYHLFRSFKRKPVWIISDRASKAGDNGEALFRYMVENHKEIDVRFAINKDCPDYERLKKIGPVLAKESYLHKLYILVCRSIISSHAEREIYNPFGKTFVAYRDILNKKHLVFLQHGVTINDVSSWLNKYNKNFSGFVTAAYPEHESILNGDYYYGEEKIWLTGFPRFDLLEDKREKIVTIMPTWRRYLLNRWDKDTDIWSLLPEFHTSKFFNFYNELLNDEDLIEAAKKYGYKLQFMPHPTLQPHIELFRQNDAVEFLDSKISYSDIYSKSALVVTDYSSAVFDFSYMKKPVIYTQFDYDEFFAGAHVYKRGYFDYKNGFGEIEYDLASTVKRIIEYMENDCRLKDEYRNRIDKFFAYHDKNNCERVYKKIIEIE